MAASTYPSDLPAGLSGLTAEQRALLMLRMRRKAQLPTRAEEDNPLVRAPRDGGLPLSFAQARLWVVDRLQPGNPAYNIAVTVRLDGPLDEPALFAAFADLVARQESLRTVFRPGEAGPVQVVLPPVPPPIPVIDLAALPKDLRRPELLRLAQDDAHTPFDLAGGRLLRLRLLRLAPAESALSVNMHHIVSDGWSVGIFVRELGTFYQARAAGVPAALPELPVQYADFAVWQRRWLTGEVLERQLEYWKERLADAPTSTELPAVKPRPAVRTLGGGRQPYDLPPVLVQELRALSARSGATLFMAMLAGLAALLSRHSGETDLLIGSPVAGRNRAELEGLIGFFVNNLVLRCDLAGDPGFAELVGRARQTTVDAQAHQDLPFEKLVEELNLPRDLTRNPLFEVSLSMQSGGTAPLALPGLSLAIVPVSPGTARQDLMLAAIETEKGGIVGYLEYSTDLFDAVAARHLLDRLGTLLAAAVADPQRPLSALPLLSEGERWQLLGEWNDTARPQAATTFPEAWEALVRRRPDAAAVAFGDGSLTYAELDRRAGVLALYLCAMGIGPEVPVGLALPRSLALAVGILAIWKAGGVYVPLDPSYPEERLALYLEETGLLVLVTEEELLDTLPRFFGFTVALDRDWPMIEASAGGQTLAGDLVPGNLAYLIFTSGSTGRPKGVGIPHAGLVHLAEAVAATFGPAPGRRAAFYASIAFDASIFELAVAFFRGGTLDVVPRDEVLPGPDLERWLAEREMAAWTVTPSALAALPGGPLPALADLVVAGEACPAELAARWAPGRRFWNAYGPTEMTVWITTERVAADGAAPPIGRPIPGGTVYAVDAHFRLVPPGRAGELVSGSPGLARGYWNRPEVTAERFVPDPWGATPGGRLYRTGDLVRFLPDGRLAFVGRNDQQVKVRGVRLEIGEVEAVLGQHPGLAEAAVVLSGEGLEARLVAFYAPRDGDLPAGELRRHLAERLPEAMVPASFVSLTELPQTPNGKVDRKALAALGSGELASTPEGYVAPRGPEEELVAALMADVLGRERIGRGESFFERGGHSLLATRLVTRLHEAFGVDVALAEVFETPTVEGLAGRLMRRAGEEGGVRPAIVPRPAGESAPLSFSQQRLWFLQRLNPWSVAYNLPGGVRLSGPYSVPALAASLGEIVRRHEVLRTAFVETAGEPVQEVRPYAPPPLPEVDLSALPGARREAELQALGELLAQQPFDLARGRLFRLALFRAAPEEGALLFVLHHAVADGWSMGILVRELGALYRAAVTGEPAALPGLPVQYADFAAWQRAFLAGEELERQLGYWKEVFARLPEPLALPADRPRPAEPSQRGSRRPFALPADVSFGLAALARRQGATLFMALVAAWQVLLARLAGTDEVVVGTPIAGRDRPEVEGLIGFFVNTLALSADLGGDPPFAGFLARARAAALGAYTHQNLPFEKLVEELAPERSLERTPLFQVMLSLESSGRGEGLALPGLSLAPWGIERGAANFDLSLDLRDVDGDLFGSLEYQVDLFEAATVDRWLASLEALLAGAVAEPERPVSRLPLASASERHQLLAEWTDSPDVPAAGATLPDLLAAQVAKTPDAVAVVAGEERLTYAELERRAGNLAARLRRLGVGPEVTVGLHLERGVGLVAGLWGILLAGGAYVPLDPAWPRERRALVIGDSGAGIVVTDRAGEGEWGGWGGVVLGIGGSDGSDAGRRWWSAALPGSLAYLIYTSGSTGKPKGVAIEHRSAVALATWVGRMFSAVELSGVLASTSIAFDMSVFELALALAHGGRAILAANALALPELPARAEVTLVNTVPTAMAELLRTGGLPPGVCTANLGGEPLPAALVDEVLARGIGRVVNLYGPSEDTTYSTWSEPAGDAPVAIGRPVDGTRVYLLSAAGEPVPLGAAGELHLAGAGLARGYLGQPERTAEQFVPDPFGAPGDRLYRTGDLARYRADGTLDYLGRLDSQVKVRGLRIEPGEVEAALAAFPGVAESAVAAVAGGADAQGERLLAAFVVARDPASPPEPPDLFTFLRSRLPPGYVPSRFVSLPALPRLANGKIDRRALTLSAGEAPAAGTPPRGAVEQTLAALWEELLETAPIHREDHFFARGGHSLLAARLVTRIRGDFGIELPLRAIFEAPTLEALARTLEEELAAETEAAVPPLVARPAGATAPLSFAQERLWFLDRLQPGTSTYNLVFAARLSGGEDPCAMAAALATVVARHETLRSRFPERDGRPVAEVLSVGTFPALARVDLTALPAARAEAAAGGWAEREALRPFDLAAGPLFRAALFELPGGDALIVLGLHHIIADGWSLGILAREISLAYAAAERGKIPALPPLPVQYGGYAAWQRAWLQGEALAERLGYWRRALAGAPPLVTLPADRPRPAVQSPAGAALRHTLPEEVAAAAAALAREHEATTFMVLLAAFTALVARAAGDEDVVVGVPTAGRDRAEVEGLIGCFVNTLAVRVDLAGDPTGAGIVARVREALLDALAHQEVPFEKLVAELAPERDLSHTPLFQLMIQLQNAATGTLDLGPQVGIELAPLPAATSQFDLSISYEEGAGGALHGVYLYATALYDRTTIERTAGRLTRLLAALAEEPARRLSELPLLSAVERQQVAVEWPTARGPRAGRIEGGALFAERCAAAVVRRPDAVGWVGEETALSYGELESRSSALSGRLVAGGIGPESVVALLGPRGLGYWLAALGVARAGAAWLPLDPEHPPARLTGILERSGAARLLADPVDLELANELAAGLAEIEVESWLPGSAGVPPAKSLEVGKEAEHLAYLLYTSGSTGEPKGVMVPQRAWVNHLLAKIEDLELSPTDTVAQTASHTFDISIWQAFAPLLVGGRARLFGPDTTRDPARLWGALAEEGVTVFENVPSVLAAIVDELPEGGARPPLRLAVSTGEALPAALTRRWFARLPGIPLVNGYGPTEAADRVSHHFLHEPEERNIVPLGRPIRGLRLSVLDPALRPLPIGSTGELGISGTGVARGYRGDPARTAEAFVPDPASGSTAPPGSRLYLSGDLVRFRADGRLDYLGRRDHQVKLRGVRIEIGEIEAALGTHPAVRQGAVEMRALSGAPALVAYVAGEAPADELRSHLRDRLPEAMIPTAFVYLEALPRTPSGKLDRRALPDPAPARPPEPDPGPLTPLEIRLAALWREVLELPDGEPLGRRESFFSRGGDSLRGAILVNRLRRRLDADLPVAVLFAAPSLADLAAWLTEHQPAAVSRWLGSGAESAMGGAIPRLPPGAPAPLSLAQERIWFLHTLAPESAAYNLPAAYRLWGPLDVPALRRAVQEVLARHQVLHSRIELAGGVPRSRVGPVPAEVLPVVDLSALPEPVAAARRLAAAEAARPFELEAGGALARALLFELGPDDRAVVFTFHHVAADGWSLGLWAREVEALYHAAAEGRPAALPPLPLQYGDFAAWQRGQLAGEALEGEVAWWKDRLAGAPPFLDLPLDRRRPQAPSFRGAATHGALPPQATARLKQLAAASGASLFMTLLAAFAALLGRLAGQDDVVVGAPIAGRNRPELEGLIGCFINTLALRVRPAAERSFRGLLAEVKEDTLGAFSHQEMPFERLLEELQPARDLSRTPVFQVLLNLLNLPTPALDLPGLAMANLELAEAPAKFDLTLYAQEMGDTLRLQLVYAADLFDPARMVELVRQLTGLVSQIVESPDAALGRHSLVTPEAAAVLPDPRQRLDATFRGAVHELVRERARQDPHHPVVIDRGGTATYGELDAASDALAADLARRGLGRGGVAAVLAHRSLPLPMAILGILKTGAAYLVLDPKEPAARLAEKVRLARPALLLRILAAGPVPEALAGLRLETLEVPRELPDRAEPFPSPAVGPHDLACLSFTSGSTGEPKGVLQTHGSMSYFLPWFRDRLGLTPADRIPLLAGLAHDPLQRDLFHALASGATLVIPDPDRIGAPGYLAGFLRERQATVAHLTPALAQLLCDSAEESDRGTLTVLRHVLFGGDALQRALVARVSHLAPNAAFLNLYGATESHRALAFAPVDPRPEPTAPPILPLGQGIPGTQLLVLTAIHQLAGIGEIGEIAIRSPHLAAGYLPPPTADTEVGRYGETTAGRVADGHPGGGAAGELPRRTGEGEHLGRPVQPGHLSATSEPARRGSSSGRPGDPHPRFIPNPLREGALPEPTDRLYLTGDLGRYRPDGQVEAAGRADRQIKIRGFRVEPAEIEAALTRLPGVTGAAVRPWKTGEETRLAAYVVASSEISLPALRQALRDQLPEALRPTWLLRLDRLPLNPNGKVDQEALPEPTAGALGRSPTEPRDLLELRLLSIWEDVLGHPLGLDDDFFDSGGHSLLAVRLLARIAEDLGRTLPLAALFAAATVRDLATLLREEGGELADRPLVLLRRGDPAKPLFLVHPIGGQVAAAYLPLSRILAWEGEIYALQDTLPAGEPRTLAGMAETYLREVRQARPGPYRLAGWSFGGRLAFEMARQLREAGEEVAFLGLLDTGYAVPPERQALDDAEALREVFPALTPELARLPEGEDALTALLANAQAAGALPAGFSPAEARRRLDLLKAHLDITPRYRPRFYPGHVDLFVAAETWPEGGEEDPSHGWAALSGTIALHRVPGDHVGLMREPENLSVLAAKLDELLRG